MPQAVSQFGAPQPSGGEKITVDVCGAWVVCPPERACQVARSHSRSVFYLISGSPPLLLARAVVLPCADGETVLFPATVHDQGDGR